ncbi:MAG: hypothetical protein IAG10_21575 [Planctomycetaceae bacterium]|nr:hypothetical protein [Planctomycetaceae bacterium]
MDLTLSPDLDARLCYSVVAIAGLVAAIFQVRRRLSGISAWLLFETWLLFLAYVGIPLLLFWFLDRSGAIADTSLFAALLVGFGYERILTGGLDKIQPGDFSRLWEPLVAWADRVAKRVGDRIQRRQSRLRDSLIEQVANDDMRFTALRQLAEEASADVAMLGAALVQIATNHQGRNQTVIKRRQARQLYDEIFITTIEPTEKLRSQGVLLPWDYWWEYRELRTYAVIVVVLFVVLSLSIPSVSWATGTQAQLCYHTWRIEKARTSDMDCFRSRYKLAELLSSPTATETRQRLIRTLRTPGVPVTRVDVVLGLLLERTWPADRSESNAITKDDRKLSEMLIGALRAENVDVRTRIHQSLVFLHHQVFKSSELPADLTNWKPTEGDTPARVEEFIRAWESEWNATRCDG